MATATTIAQPTSIQPAKPALSVPINSAVKAPKVNDVLRDASSAGAQTNVRILRLDEWREAALSIAEAFKDDEVSLYFTDTPDRAGWTKEQKWELHLRIMEFIVYAHLLKGLVVCAGPNYDCIALWYGPNRSLDRSTAYEAERVLT